MLFEYLREKLRFLYFPLYLRRVGAGSGTLQKSSEWVNERSWGFGNEYYFFLFLEVKKKVPLSLQSIPRGVSELFLHLSFLVDLWCLCLSSGMVHQYNPHSWLGSSQLRTAEGGERETKVGWEGSLPDFDRYTIHCLKDPEHNYMRHPQTQGRLAASWGGTSLGTGNRSFFCLGWLLLFFSFFGCTHVMWEFPSQELNSHHGSDLGCCSNNTSSQTHWAIGSFL